jgi:hypothetical protein
MMRRGDAFIRALAVTMKERRADAGEPDGKAGEPVRSRRQAIPAIEVEPEEDGLLRADRAGARHPALDTDRYVEALRGKLEDHAVFGDDDGEIEAALGGTPLQ